MYINNNHSYEKNNTTYENNSRVLPSYTPIKPKDYVSMTGFTWYKDSHGLYDYETTNRIRS